MKASTFLVLAVLFVATTQASGAVRPQYARRQDGGVRRIGDYLSRHLMRLGENAPISEETKQEKALSKAACVALREECSKECRTSTKACREACVTIGDCACHQTLGRKSRECRNGFVVDFKECMQAESEAPKPSNGLGGGAAHGEISADDAVPTEVVETEEKPKAASKQEVKDTEEKADNEVNATSEAAEDISDLDKKAPENAASVQVQSRSGGTQSGLEVVNVDP